MESHTNAGPGQIRVIAVLEGGERCNEAERSNMIRGKTRIGKEEQYEAIWSEKARKGDPKNDEAMRTETKHIDMW